MDSPTPKKAGKPIGRAMLVASFALVLFGLTTVFDGVLDRQMNPNNNPVTLFNDSGIPEVVLQRNRQGHYVSPGIINGVKVQFLLDTGATDVAIPLEIARKTNLVRGLEGRANTASGLTVVYDTHIDLLQLGNITLRDIDASIIPDMPGEVILLGMSALKQIEFAQQGTALTLRQPYSY